MSYCQHKYDKCDTICRRHNHPSTDKPINISIGNSRIPLFLGQQLRLIAQDDITLSSVETIYGTQIVIGRSDTNELPPGIDMFQIASENEGARAIVPSAQILTGSILTFRGEGRTQVSIDQAAPNDNTLIIDTPFPDAITLGISDNPLGPDIVSSPLLGGGNLRLVQGNNITLSHTTLPDGGAITIESSESNVAFPIYTSTNGVIDGPGNLTVGKDLYFSVSAPLAASIDTSDPNIVEVMIDIPGVLTGLSVRADSGSNPIIPNDSIGILGGANVTTTIASTPAGPEIVIDSTPVPTSLTLASANDIEGPNTSTLPITDGDVMRFVGGTNTTVSGSTATDGAQVINIDTVNPLELTISGNSNLSPINQGDNIQIIGSGAIQTVVTPGPTVTLSAPNLLENLVISDGTNIDPIGNNDTISILGGTNITTTLVSTAAGPELTVDTPLIPTSLTLTSADNVDGPDTSTLPITDGDVMRFTGGIGINVIGTTAADNAQVIQISSQLDLSAGADDGVASINQGDLINVLGSGAIQTSISAGPTITLSAPNVLENLVMSDGTNTDPVESNHQISILGGTNITTTLVSTAAGPELTVDTPLTPTSLTLQSADTVGGLNPSSVPVTDNDVMRFVGEGEIITSASVAVDGAKTIVIDRNSIRLGLRVPDKIELTSIQPNESVGFVPDAIVNSGFTYDNTTGIFTPPQEGSYNMNVTCNLVNLGDIALATSGTQPSVLVSLISQGGNTITSSNFSILEDGAGGYILPGVQTVSMESIIRIPEDVSLATGMSIAITNLTDSTITLNFGDERVRSNAYALSVLIEKLQ